MTSRTRAAVRAAACGVVERLEARRLLSAGDEGLSYRFEDDTIFVDGTAGDDDVSVRLDPDDGSVVQLLTDGNVIGRFDYADVAEVRIRALGGDDTIVIALPRSAAIGAVVWGGEGDDRIKGSGWDDVLRGEAGDDTLAGGGGDDELFGGGGEDRLDGRGGDDELSGGAGEDRLVGDAGDDEITGGGDDDWIDGGSGDDELFAGSGDDEVVGGGGDDEVSGARGDDSVAGGTGEDTLKGDGGDDEITGGTDDDVVRGNDGEDTLWGGEGEDTIAGGQDEDVLNVEQGVDYTKGSKYDTINNDKYRNPLKRLDDEAGLKAWLIDRAVKQWRGYLGNSVWRNHWYYCDCVFFRSTTGPVMVNDAVAGSAAPPDHSTTNVQEQGVDEADLVKTDGEYLYLVSDGELVIVDAWPASEMHVVSRTPISGSLSGIYLKRDTLTVVANTYESNAPDEEEGASKAARWFGWSTAQTQVTVLDVSDRTEPEVIEQTTLDGAHSDTRMIGGRLYVVVNNWRNLPEPLVIDETPEEPEEPAEVPEDGAEARLAYDGFWEGSPTGERYETEAEYRARLEAMSLEELLPDYKTTVGDTTFDGDLADLSNFYVPGDEDEEEYYNNMFSVVMFDVTDDEAGVKSTTSVAGLNGQVYASTDSLYVTATSWDRQIDTWRWWSGEPQTDIYKFDLGPSDVKLGGSGQVPGWIVNQFSLDEEDGILRIATTSNAENGQSNNVFTLADTGKDLEIVGGITDLAFSERIYSVRFVGDRGYIVTFRQTDPLFTIDLSDPANPEVKGILKIPGYSSYLHPIDDGLVIGVGRNGTEDGRVLGVQVSLFDVSDMENPTRLHTHTFENEGDARWGSWTAAEWDHHAFSYFPQQKVLALPMVTGDHWWHSEDGGPTYGLHVLKVDRESGFTSLGAVEHSGQAPLRSLRIGHALYSIGYDAIRVVDLTNPDDVLRELENVIRPDDGYYYGGPGILIRPISIR